MSRHSSHIHCLCMTFNAVWITARFVSYKKTFDQSGLLFSNFCFSNYHFGVIFFQMYCLIW
ncbi:unnamed protein product, partial [Larinioides sclopetarius]